MFGEGQETLNHGLIMFSEGQIMFGEGQETSNYASLTFIYA